MKTHYSRMIFAALLAGLLPAMASAETRLDGLAKINLRHCVDAKHDEVVRRLDPRALADTRPFCRELTPGGVLVLSHPTPYARVIETGPGPLPAWAQSPYLR